MLPLPNNAASRPKHRLSLVVLLLWLVLISVLALNRQTLVDWWRLRSYQAPAAIAQLASQDTMTDYARKVFYVNAPLLAGKPEFAQACSGTGAGREQTIVLGCYRGNQGGIFLLDVSDPRLNGVEEVTAAHEMLHAAYDRLDGDERREIDGLLQDYYQNDLKDQRILKTIEGYKKTEPYDVVNEMHSIFATEIATLPAELENYYKRYFSNRSQVVAFAAKYQSEFTSRQTSIANYDSRLERLKAQIETAKADLETRQQAIATARDELNSLRSNGNVTAYNAGVPAYNNLIDAYNSEAQRIRSLIRQFNELVAARNAIALEASQLAKELDANTTPIER